MTISKKIFSFCCVGLMASALSARADSVKLTLTGDSSSPYKFTIHDYTTNTTTTNVYLSCLNDNRSVSLNEWWYATSENLETLITNGVAVDTTLSASTEIKDLKEAAWLDSLYGTGFIGASNSDIQDAIWSILNPGSVSLTSKQTTLISDAVGSLSTETSSFYSQFTFYYPKNGNGSTSEPQQFMGYTPIPPPPATPEPSSLLLMGTGIVGIAGMLRRRAMMAKG